MEEVSMQRTVPISLLSGMRKIRHGKISFEIVVVVKLVHRAHDDVADAAIRVITLEHVK
jgi:hypothetical protein